jgi:hypothetical protein
LQAEKTEKTYHCAGALSLPMRAMMIALLLACASADVYMQNPRGS